MPYIAALHATRRHEARAVELHLTPDDVIFVDEKNGRALRRFDLLSLTATEAVVAPGPGAEPSFTLSRCRRDTNRIYVHVFASPEVGMGAEGWREGVREAWTEVWERGCERVLSDLSKRRLRGRRGRGRGGEGERAFVSVTWL